MISGSSRRAPVLLAGLVAVLAALLPATAAEAYPGAPWFKPSTVYTSNFPDPDVLVQGDTYYAYGTSTGGAYLPVMTSRDQSTWTARPAYDPGPPLDGDPYFNDALPHPARWGGDFGGGRMTKQVWAPSVEQFGPGRYIAFYSIRLPPTSARPERFCISTAIASSPLGPFRDDSPGPLVCDADPKGSIDPEPFRDPATGKAYLLWKSEGVPGSQPTKMWIRELSPDGWTFAAGSTGRELLRTSQGWEGNVIESPSMVRHNGQLYLFYSANEWASDRYAIGYATCASVEGPCSKPRSTPLLASSGDRLGPGAPSAYVDAQGRLKMAYHWWNAPYTSYPAYPACTSDKSCTSRGQRRMSVVEVGGSGGGLQAGAPSQSSSPPPPPPPVSGTGNACPAGLPEDGFGDVPQGSVHEPTVDCVVWWRVAFGAGGRYAPDAGVNRGQMASFLVRAVLESGGSLPEPDRSAFRDDDGTVHEDAIGRLAAAGVVSGTGKDRYSPSAPVSRAQMATFLVRALEHRTGQRSTASRDWFQDDAGNTHEPAINTAASVGLAGGTGGGAYSPGLTVRRDQMATFLARLLEKFVVQAGARTPAQR